MILQVFWVEDFGFKVVGLGFFGLVCTRPPRFWVRREFK